MPKKLIDELNPEIENIANLLEKRYQMAGYSRHLFYMDRGLLRRLGKPVQEITNDDIENVLMEVSKQRTKALYRTRFKSIFNSLKDMGILVSVTV